MTAAAVRRLGPVLAIALVILVDAIVLAGAAWNRRGEPDAVITMTERELPIAFTWKENSGLWLRLDWNQYELRYDDLRTGEEGLRPAWKSLERIRTLGFDVSVPPDHADAEVFYSKTLPLERYAVLEFEGESWARWLREEERRVEELAAKIARGEEPSRSLESAQKSLDSDRVARSRLSIVDLGRDPRELRRQYPDGGRFLVTRAVVSLRWDRDLNRRTDFRLDVDVRDLQPDEIQVSRPQRPVPDAIRRRAAQEDPQAEWHYVGRGQPPRYEVEVRYGRRLEPWIASIRELPEAPQEVTPDPAIPVPGPP